MVIAQTPSSSALRRQSPLTSRPAVALPAPDQVTLSEVSASSDPPAKSRISRGLLAALSLSGVALGLAGCGGSPPTPPDQVQTQTTGTRLSYAMISTEQEVALGKQVAAQVEKETPLWSNAAAQQRIDSLGQRLARFSSRTDITYTFKLLDTPTVNAMAVPGGTIYVTRGLYEDYADDAELAFVMGHELGHVEQRHSIKQMEKMSLIDLAVRIATRGKGNTVQLGAGVAEKLLANQFSQADEAEADRLGQHHLRQLGYDPSKAVSAMERLSSLTGSGEHSHINTRIFGDHPPTQDRIEALRKGAAQ